MIQTQVSRHKRRVFKALLIITAIGGAFFFVINFSRGLHALAAVELVTGLLSLLLLIKVNRNYSEHHFRQLTLIYVLLFYSIMMFALTRPQVSQNIFMWIQVIPILSYLLLGLKRGLMITILFVVSFAVYYFFGMKTAIGLNNVASVANVIFCTLVTWGLSHSYEKATDSSQRKLRKLATTDHLTGLFNRSLLNSSFEQAKKKTDFEFGYIGLVVLDLDNFKAINDAHGHDTGDKVLIAFAEIINQGCQSQCEGFRIGGEEFCLILSDTNLIEATSIAEFVRKQTRDFKLERGSENINFSVSCGVAVSDSPGVSFETLHAMADKRLYQAKASGRNKVVNHG